ncbi:DUF916 domain-containing protein [Bacillus sp. JJ1533]|uniref:DUF916 domain-containing protein n=1 Tax=Bacillus sp. JJ1533 TaxID=3122959 RepID=UPI002FFE0745
MKKLYVFVIMLFLMIGLYPTSIFGENTSPISVSPVLPENQVKEISSYFYLQVEPNQQQILHFNVQNLSDKEQTVKLFPVDAFTLPTGGIFYEEKSETDDSQLLEPTLAISNFITIPETVTVPPNSSKQVAITVKVPNVTEGTFVGAIRAVGLSDQEQQVETGETNVTIRNQITFTTGIVLELPNQPNPQFSFGEVGIRTNPPTTELWFELFNKAQMVLRGTTISYEVIYQDEVLFSGTTEAITMVPNTVIRFPVEWQYGELEPGTYQVNLSANVMGEEIQHEESFEVEDEQTEEHEQNLEQADTEHTQTGTSLPWWIWVVGGVVLILVFLMAYLLGKRNRR